MASPRSPTSRARLPVAVIALGLTSFFTDVASDMIVPLLPAFLATLGASTAMLGLIEGAAEATASFLKLGSGYVADRAPRKKPLVVVGYAIATFARPLIALAAIPAHVLAIRVVDRVGKGVRTAPRDAMIAAAAEPGEAGRAFGFHRAMDHAGAVVGPLVATALIALGLTVRGVFAAALIPGVIALLCVLSVREPAPEAMPVAKGEAPTIAGPAVPRSLRGYLGILALFALGNSSDAFLLLRAQDLGVPVAMIPVLWAVLHVSKVASTWIGGDLADRVPRPRLVAIGWIVYALTYLALGVATEAWQAWVIFVVYGAYHGLTEPAEKAMVKDLAPPSARGRAFGLYHFVIGVTAIPAGLLTGWIWEAFGPLHALGLGALIAAISGALLIAWDARGGLVRA
ncbi:MFS transporter [Sandaracinus amylolyticus]|uniref:Major facilitator superfamily MFS_1 n=1 Tax=Sandaracinus amylolyticus TaxID=927083 RepID=A0A0F6W8L2_9BACT|nr:MFS transporter [Sandaracinus amylolyticus]AKF10173.1 major facilitator superfamily MFS_1 [Sandaracinus amylolyticus]